ncbi:hypothetical protein JTE90_011057 [Oedothorax gibbosus]|uniref:Uncharacterized protein n=1 Tax=Oedothorax gibbosus TaxID=931172 RepID=A0AAV6VCS7_9ARAC|nr:hypothetical protein JTE90_011057 [Oedothorax gibbosus]
MGPKVVQPLHKTKNTFKTRCQKHHTPLPTKSTPRSLQLPDLPDVSPLSSFLEFQPALSHPDTNLRLIGLSWPLKSLLDPASPANN